MDVPCGEFAQFRQILGEYRATDDKITHRLNTTIPTRSNIDDVDAKTNCEKLWNEMSAAHLARTAAMEKCLHQIKAEVLDLKASLGQSDADMRAQQGKGRNSVEGRTLREKQALVRDIQRELMTEEILQEQTAKAFKDRCGRYWNPSS
eukprot:TRINITY_DN6339_c0_g1_i1.p1 TRINITY_DN6339_c0_g1~~TRINITY_DN6339_c0_g1_i1.p1  ORF type:complete len:160 (+),score=12.75 TRINITY_DN6339_c0_g1_i1:39-482(+)